MCSTSRRCIASQRGRFCLIACVRERKRERERGGGGTLRARSQRERESQRTVKQKSQQHYACKLSQRLAVCGSRKFHALLWFFANRLRKQAYATSSDKFKSKNCAFFYFYHGLIFGVRTKISFYIEYRGESNPSYSSQYSQLDFRM